MANKSQRLITVRFKALGEKSLTDAIKALDRASKDLTRTQKQLSKTTEDVRKSQKKTRKSTRILGGAFATIRSKMLLFNFAMGLGVRQLGKFASASSKVANMERAFNTLSGATENSGVALEKLKAATNGTMSEFNLFQQANNAMILGVSKNSDEMAEMFDIAQRLGRALGRDTASSVESLITGIGRQSRLMLDNIGIIVKADEAYEAYAKKLDISVDLLTDQERKHAFLQAAMESARKKVKDVGDEVETNQDIYDNLSRATQELSIATGELLTPRMTQLSKFFTKAAETATSYFKSLTLGNKVILESTSVEQGMLILLARRQALEKELRAFSNQNAMIGLRQDKEKEIAKAKLIEVDEAIHQLNLGNKQALIDLLSVKQKENIVDGDKITQGLYRREIAEQELAILINKNEALKGGLNTEEQLSIIEDQMILNQLKRNNGDITAQELKKKDLELTGKKIELEEKLKQKTTETAGATLKALSSVASENLKNARLAKDLALAGAFVDMYAGMNKAFQQGGTLGFLSGAAILASGMANIAQIQAQEFEQGGLIGGKRHSQGGTLIEAEQGEFIMSRNAVNSIGIDTLNAMNQGQSPITLNISAPLVDETVIDSIIPAIEKAQRMNLA